MRKRRITALVMALVLGVAAFSGCGKKDADSKYKVYYVNENQGEILAESFLPSEEKTSTMVDEMTDKLNKKNAEGHTLLPNGVQIRECVNDDGMLLVDFTPEYRGLNPVDEVLLRASIVKDYVQIPDIYLVTITVVGEPIVDSQGKEIGAMSLDNFLENTGKEIMAYQYKELNLYFTNRFTITATHRSKKSSWSSCFADRERADIMPHCRPIQESSACRWRTGSPM